MNTNQKSEAVLSLYVFYSSFSLGQNANYILILDSMWIINIQNEEALRKINIYLKKEKY